MEIRNSPEPLPVSEWENSSLVEELCLALRDVGVFNLDLPDGPSVRKSIVRVKNLYAEIERRQLNVSPRVIQLSRETQWDMETLLRDTLAFPEAVPYLASTPGPRCINCGKQISRRATLALCPPCIQSGLEQLSLSQPEPEPGICSNCGLYKLGFWVSADGLDWRIYCQSCLEAEQNRFQGAG